MIFFITQWLRFAATKEEISANLPTFVFIFHQDFKETAPEGADVSAPQDAPPNGRFSSRVRNRWFLAITLSRNPSLIPARRTAPVLEMAQETKAAYDTNGAASTGHDSFAMVVQRVDLPPENEPV